MATRKKQESDEAISARVDAMIAERKRNDAIRSAQIERSSTLGVMRLLLFAFVLSLAAQVLLPIFFEKSKLAYYFLMLVHKLHFITLLLVAWRTWNAVLYRAWDIRIYYSLLLLFGVWSFFDLGSRCERYTRNYLFSETAPVKAHITYSGYKGTGVGQRIDFSYEWHGKIYTNSEEYSNEYYFSHEKALKKGKTLQVFVSTKFPSLYYLAD